MNQRIIKPRKIIIGIYGDDRVEILCEMPDSEVNIVLTLAVARLLRDGLSDQLARIQVK